MATPALPNHIAEFFAAHSRAQDQPLEEWLEPALRSIREHLCMDVAFISEFKDGERILTHVDASSPNDQVVAGSSAPLEETYCQMIADGRLPELLPDISVVSGASDIAEAAKMSIGAHLSVPIRLSDGRVHGTLCCFSHCADQSLNERDLNVMRVLADMVAERISRDMEAKQAQKAMEERIRSVLSDGSMSIVYQPIQSLTKNRIVGFESLARFSALPLRGPDVWFDEAAQVGLGLELELKAIELALQGACCLPGDVYLSINASPDTILTGHLERLVDAWPVNRLMLEVTEHAFVKAYKEMEIALRPLRARNLRLAVDDVGSGYANFQHILNLKPDLIKLDIAITRNIDSDLSRRALAAAMVGFANETGLEIVAEGVETESELAALRQLGVRNVQGFLTGKPMPIASAMELAQQSFRVA
jgi:EAL domain-containing protein (putative c-di-GMP-specific phosphodiesterase class I)